MSLGVYRVCRIMDMHSIGKEYFFSDDQRTDKFIDFILA